MPDSDMRDLRVFTGENCQTTDSFDVQGRLTISDDTVGVSYGTLLASSQTSMW